MFFEKCGGHACGDVQFGADRLEGRSAYAEVGDTSGELCAFTRSLFCSGFVGGVACVSFLLISLACLVADEYFDGPRDELVVFALPGDGRHEVGVGDDFFWLLPIRSRRIHPSVLSGPRATGLTTVCRIRGRFCFRSRFPSIGAIRGIGYQLIDRCCCILR